MKAHTTKQKFYLSSGYIPQLCSCLMYHRSFRLFLQCPFKSITTQRCSLHSTDTVSEFHFKAKQATASEGLPKVHTWRLERDTNPRPSGRKASTQQMFYHTLKNLKRTKAYEPT